jgi:hypothetical protein
MPAQRLSHPQQSTSRKVTALDDFAYRVWEQTKLSADDFGVLPFDASVLRADNARLRKHATERQVQTVLQHLVTVGLLALFTHQGETYAYSPVWQTWQQVKYPRKTHRPKPTPEALAACDDLTRWLFEHYPGGGKVRKFPGGDSGNVPGNAPVEGREDSEPQPGRIPANANANADPVLDLGRGAGRGPSLTSSSLAWHREHGGHVTGFCDWVCLPQVWVETQAGLVVEAKGMPHDEAVAGVVAWATGIRDGYRERAEIPAVKRPDWFWAEEWARTARERQQARAGGGLAAYWEAAARG